MKFAVAGTVALAFAAVSGGFAEDESGDDEGGSPSHTVRAEHDVACRLTTSLSEPAAADGTVRAKLVAKNRGRKRERVVTLSVFADFPTGTPLWTDTIDLRGHHRRTRKLLIHVPAGTKSLVAVATCDDDGNPGNNISGAPATSHGDDDDDEGGDDGGGGGTTVPPTDAAVLAGAATYATNCASCHGVSAAGTRLGPRIAGAPAHEILEAMREGEDSMPTFPGMTWTDAQNLAAYLANPSAATPPVTPPPVTNDPTFAGEIKSVMDTSCAVCHTGSNAPKNVRLDSQATVGANAAKALAAMQAGTMPPGGALPAATVQLFADWIAGGKK